MHRTLASGPIVWLGIIITTCLLLMIFQTVLWLVMPVLLAIVAYYLMSPLVVRAMALGMTRARAVFMVTMLLSLIMGALAISVYPKISMATRNFPQLVNEYTGVGNKLIKNAENTLYHYFPFMQPAHPPVNTGPVGGNLSLVSNEPAPVATPAGGVDVAKLQAEYSGDIALELVHWLPSMFLLPYITYFFLLDGPRFKRFLVQAIPNAFFEKTLYLFYRVEDQLRRYFQGLIALTTLDAFCLGVGLWVFGLKAPFFLAALAAVMAWLPYLGSIAGGLLVVLVAAHDFPDNYWLPYEVVGLFIGVRLMDDFVFMPLTVGRSLHMHPLVTVLMILLGGAVAGIAGLLLVMPVLGVVMVAGQVIGELVTDQRILARHRHARMLGQRRARVDLHVE
jgi:predicted PurR-regulated permease PerM